MVVIVCLIVSVQQKIPLTGFKMAVTIPILNLGPSGHDSDENGNIVDTTCM